VSDDDERRMTGNTGASTLSVRSDDIKWTNSATDSDACVLDVCWL